MSDFKISYLIWVIPIMILAVFKLITNDTLTICLTILYITNLIRIKDDEPKS
jgi:hypothetical protein